MARVTLKSSNLILVGIIVGMVLCGCSKSDDDGRIGQNCFAANPLLLQQLQQGNSPNSDDTIAALSNGAGDNQVALASAQPRTSSFDDFDDEFAEHSRDEFLNHRNDIQEQVLNLPGIGPGRINFGSALNRDDDHDFDRDDVFFSGRFEDRFEYGFEDRFDD